MSGPSPAKLPRTRGETVTRLAGAGSSERAALRRLGRAGDSDRVLVESQPGHVEAARGRRLT